MEVISMEMSILSGDRPHEWFCIVDSAKFHKDLQTPTTKPSGDPERSRPALDPKVERRAWQRSRKIAAPRSREIAPRSREIAAMPRDRLPHRRQKRCPDAALHNIARRNAARKMISKVTPELSNLRPRRVPERPAFT